MSRIMQITRVGRVKADSAKSLLMLNMPSGITRPRMAQGFKLLSTVRSRDLGELHMPKCRTS